MKVKKNNSKSSSKKNQTIERVEIDNTPFTAIKLQEDWYLTLGRYHMTKQCFQSVEQIREYLKDPLYIWRTIATFSSIIAAETVNSILNEKK